MPANSGRRGWTLIRFLFPADPKSMQALLAGGLDFAHVSGGVSVQANLSGAEVTIIGTGSNSMSAGIIAAKEIKSYQDLKGKKVGIASFGGNNDIGFRFAFTKEWDQSGQRRNLSAARW